MCGLVGIAGKLDFKDEEVMRRLLYLDYWRGKDSTGLGAVRGNKQMMVAKAAIDPLLLFDTNRFKTALSGYNSIAFIGHNRAATKGEINAANAHPFLIGDILGAHNGTLTRNSHKALEKELDEEYNVDSEALIAAIEKLGVKKTIEMCEEGRSYQDGAWALTWYNKNDNTINFLRNKHRPLWYAYSEAYDKLFWASEYWMIEVAIRHTEWELAVIKEKDRSYRFFVAEADTHYRWDLDELKKGSKSRPKPKAAQIKGKEPVVYASQSWDYSHGANDPFGRDQTSDGTGTPTNSHTNGSSSRTQTSMACLGTTINKIGPQNTSKKSLNSGTSMGRLTKLKDAPAVDDTVLFAGDKDNPFAGLFTKEKFEEIARWGCSHCMKDVNWGDTGITIFERDGAILCPDCSSIDEGKKQNRVFVRNIREFHQ